MKTIGQKISPILEEIEDTLWEHEADELGKPDFDMAGFRAAAKIFMSVLMDKMWELQDKEEMPRDARSTMAKKAGEQFRDFVKTFTDIDTHELYKNGEPD